VDVKSKQVICCAIEKGKRHDFRVFKESEIHAAERIMFMADTGFMGLNKIHTNTLIPKKKTKKHPLTKEEKEFNRKISSQRIIVENVIGFIKRFRILSDRYRNRRKRIGLRFNLIAGICNSEICA
jgi:hypothetical protein